MYKMLYKMEEMKYTKEINKNCLHEEDYKGYKIIILSLGTHPCGYIGIKDKKNNLYKKSYNELGDMEFYGNVNGGFTYSSFGVCGFHPDYWFLGWDYAHSGDFNGYNLGDEILECRKNDKKWTTEEILDEAKKQIDEIKELKWEEIVIKKKVIKQ